jgi:zinc protease
VNWPTACPGRAIRAAGVPSPAGGGGLGWGLIAALLPAMLMLILTLPAGAVTIQRAVGASGVEAWLVEDHSVPVVTLRFAFAGGAALDPADRGGLAHMVAGLLDEGAGPYDTTAFQGRLEDLAADLRFSADHDSFGGSLRTLKSHLGETAELLRLALTEPRFEAGAVERVRGDIAVSLSREAQNPRAVSNRLWMLDAFDAHPYGQAVNGTTESIGRITAADLRRFVERHLHRTGLVVGAAGDLTPKELAAVVDRVFGGLPLGAVEEPVAETEPAAAGALVISRRPAPQSVVTFGHTAPKRDDPEWWAARIVDEILGGGEFRGRLMKEIREHRGLAYGVSTQLVSLRHAGLILGGVATRNSQVAQVIDLVRAEWRQMRDDGPTAEELADTKTYLTGSFPLSLDSTGRIAALLIEMQQQKLGIDYLDRRAALIDGVSLDEARAEARRLLDPDRLSFAVVGDPEGLTPTRPVPELRF